MCASEPYEPHFFSKHPLRVWRVGRASRSVQVSHTHAGAVIGPKGATLASLRDRTGCRCSVESQPTPEGERCAVVCGHSAESVCEAVDGVLSAVFTTQNPPSGAVVLVPLTAVGTLIGKGGANINQMRSSSGCNVQVGKALRETEKRDREKGRSACGMCAQSHIHTRESERELVKVRGGKKRVPTLKICMPYLPA